MADETKDTKPTPPAGDKPPRSGAPRATPVGVTIEIAPTRNRQLQWGPTTQTLRGRWDSHGLAHGDQSEAGLLVMPTIPGLHVVIDPVTGTCKTTDPLAEPENAALMRKVSDIHNQVLRGSRCPVPDVVVERCSDDVLATWTYAAMRAVQAGNARIVKGRIPDTEADIKRMYPGATITKKFFDSSEKGASDGTLQALASLLGPMAQTSA